MNEVLDFFRNLFSTESWPPRWYCGEWSNFHGWFYIISDLTIWLAYFAIPGLLLYLLMKRKDVPFLPVFWLFVLFIMACGTTHLIDAIIFWHPIYRVSALARFITAIISMFTVYKLYKILPDAFNLKTDAQLKEIIELKTKELQKLNEKLKESEHHFKSLVNNDPDIIAMFNKELEIKYINNSITHSTSKPPEFYIGKDFEQLGYLSDDVLMFEGNVKVLLNKKKTLQYETKYVHLDTVKYYNVIMVPLFNNDTGEIINIMTVTRDITDERIAGERLNITINELAHKNKRLEDFANIISHNLRAPVGNLNALLKLYEEQTDAAGIQFIMEKLNEVSLRIAGTLDDLNEAVIIDKAVNKEKEQIYFKDKLEHVRSSLSTEIMETEAVVTMDFSKCETVYFPKIYLESIFMNLFSNALKYKSPDRIPVIHFETDSVDGIVSLSCMDNGLGIDLKRHGNKLFGLYKTFHRHENAKGLGLFITKNQVEALGGNITVESELGEGSKFTIYFNAPAKN
jgi:signal transduction histidine kinase